MSDPTEEEQNIPEEPEVKPSDGSESVQTPSHTDILFDEAGGHAEREQNIVEAAQSIVSHAVEDTGSAEEVQTAAEYAVPSAEHEMLILEDAVPTGKVIIPSIAVAVIPAIDNIAIPTEEETISAVEDPGCALENVAPTADDLRPAGENEMSYGDTMANETDPVPEQTDLESISKIVECDSFAVDQHCGTGPDSSIYEENFCEESKLGSCELTMNEFSSEKQSNNNETVNSSSNMRIVEHGDEFNQTNEESQSDSLNESGTLTIDFNDDSELVDQGEALNEVECYGKPKEGDETRGVKRKYDSLENGVDRIQCKFGSSKLPKCRLTRTYTCEYCGVATQNPRAHLYHLRDEHLEAIHIYLCDRCQYASKNFTKLMRHLKMVHKSHTKQVDESGVKIKVKASKWRAPPPCDPQLQALLTVASMKKLPKQHTGVNNSLHEESANEKAAEERRDEIDVVNTNAFLCTNCNVTCKNQKQLDKHQSTCHLKRTFYRCTKCTYVTQVKGRYTKHLKYHDLPIIKCQYCDFRTPYRWNLERHARNHSGDSVGFKCHLCNFTAQIKQSLTVHVAHHHLTAEQIKEKELRRTIGVSDPQDFAMSDDEVEMMKMERDEHPDAFQLADGVEQKFTVSNLDVENREDDVVLGIDDSDTSEELKKRKPKIKMTLKKMKSPKEVFTTQDGSERHGFGEDFIHPDDIVQRNGYLYFKSYKCDLCSFKAAFKNELIRHGKKVHSVVNTDLVNRKKAARSSSGTISVNIDAMNVKKEDNEKGLPPHSESDMNDEEAVSARPVTRASDSSKDSSKKRGTFFDDLQDKLSTTNAQNLVCQYCGHNSKCLSESVRHAKLHLSAKNISATASLSTRCQFCRHRCKSTDDLANHLKLCSEARKNQIMEGSSRRLTGKTPGQVGAESEDMEEDLNDDGESSKDSTALEVVSHSRSSSRLSSDVDSGRRDGELADESAEGSLHAHATVECGFSEVENANHRFPKRVYRCDQCKFWATTASRFHVHIVSHFNKRPYVCSECSYRSNWRWDITKHIKSRVNKEGTHRKAEVLCTGETAEKNYEKYEKYVALIFVDENSSNRTEGGIPTRKGKAKKSFVNDVNGKSLSNDCRKTACPLNNEASLKPVEEIKTEEPQCSFSPSVSPPLLPEAPRSSLSVAQQPMVCIPLDGAIAVSVPLPPLTGSLSSSLTMLTTAGSLQTGKRILSASLGVVSSDKQPTTTQADPISSVIRKNSSMSPILGDNLVNSVPATAPVAKSGSQASIEPPPPLVSLKQFAKPAKVVKTSEGAAGSKMPINTAAQYQIITPQGSGPSLPQGALSTSLETLQLLASGGTTVSNLRSAAQASSSSALTITNVTSASSLTSPASVSVLPVSSAASNPMSSLAALANVVGAACGSKLGSANSPVMNLTALANAVAAGNLLPAHLRSLAQLRSRGATGETDTNKFAQQMRLLMWINLLTKEAQKKQSVSGMSTQSASSGVEKIVSGGSVRDGQNPSLPVPSDSPPQLVFDHLGNPEWKCASCNFRDSERSTVEQHRGLAHGRSVVSLLHAVHRCDVCAFAAGTKRHVQLHIDTVHGGRGGITSSCEGQSPQHGGTNAIPGQSKNVQCQFCPFSTPSRKLLKQHLTHHNPRHDCIYKCIACPYYVNTKVELFEHLSVHGLQVPIGDKRPSDNQQQFQQLQQQNVPTPAESDGPSSFQCEHCPFATRNRTKIISHRQFHRPKGLPFKCPQCSYNVTRRHLLAQHVRVHGLSSEILDHIFGPSEMSTSTTNGNNTGTERTDSPSPSLTITPINNNGGPDHAAFPLKNVQLQANSEFLPILQESETQNLPDVPLVWTSKGGQFFKMYKCRWCPHINLRKTNVLDHEKMHILADIHRPEGSVKCPYCTYTSVSINVTTAHIKVHEGILGKVHAIVDESKSDEEQIFQIKSHAMMRSLLHKVAESSPETKSETKDTKLLYCCQHCPARFFFEKEIIIHTRFHGSSSFPFTCDKCDYGVRQQSALATHAKVHSADYQENTSNFLTQYMIAPNYSPVPGLSVPACAATIPEKHPSVSDLQQVPPTSKDCVDGTRFKCSLCPSTFRKQITLQYHQSLHGANNPYKCSRCTYAAKTQDALNQHLALHLQIEKEKEEENKKESQLVEVPAQCESESCATMQESCLLATAASINTEETSAVTHPPIKLKLMKNQNQIDTSEESTSQTEQFKYYIEENIPLSGVDLLRHKTQMEQQLPKNKADESFSVLSKSFHKSGANKSKEDVDDAKRIGDPNLHYPLHVDKVSGKAREKRYKCKICPSAFEKLDQYNVHASLHGANYKYKCRICDYSVKFYANFNMHINRHKYSERIEHRETGKPLPLDSDPKYTPMVDKQQVTVSMESSEEHNPDLTTAERQHILLQNKKGIDPKAKEDDNKRVFYCQFCPYANVRRDAVDSHSLRHKSSGGKGAYQCNFCDYLASQLNFIKEHTKVHFKPFKYVVPEGFIRHEQEDLYCTEVITASQPETRNQQKMHIFSHKAGLFKPLYGKDSNSFISECDHSNKENCTDENVATVNLADPTMHSGIVIDFSTGEVMDAPPAYIITMKPSKSKSKENHNSDSRTLLSINNNNEEVTSMDFDCATEIESDFVGDQKSTDCAKSYMVEAMDTSEVTAKCTGIGGMQSNTICKIKLRSTSF